MRRLFTLGCSFSSQVYPTWNELLGMYYDEHHNYGKGGAGNRYIFTMLMSLLADGTITADDTVVVQWSSTHRYDWYYQGMWRCKGNVLCRDDMPPEIATKWYDETAGTVETLTLATAACRVLDGLGCPWWMASFVDITKVYGFETNLRDVTDPMIDRFAADLAQWRHRWATKPLRDHTIESGLPFKTWHDGGVPNHDEHPTPIMAYNWLCECLLPLMGLDGSAIYDKVMEWQATHDSLRTAAEVRTAYPELLTRWSRQIDNRRFLDRVKSPTA